MQTMYPDDPEMTSRSPGIPLEPGERLIWSGSGNPKWLKRAAWVGFAPALISLLLFIGLATYMSWQSQQRFLSTVPPQSRAFFEQHSQPWYFPSTSSPVMREILTAFRQACPQVC